VRKKWIWLGLGLYVLSFFLPAVSAKKPWEGLDGVRGYLCAYVSLVLPWAEKGQVLFKQPLRSFPLLISGWINLLFVAWFALRQFGKGAWLRPVIAAMIPMTWVVLGQNQVFPRIGHVIWIAGMLICFLSVQREAGHV